MSSPSPRPSGAPETGARAPRRDAAANRDALIAAAATALNRDLDASLAAIADEAGLSRRSVYGHFATREDLVTEVLAVGATRISSSVTSVAHPDARVEVALIGTRLWSEVEHVRVMAQLAVRGPHRERVGDALEPVRRMLRAAVRRGVDAGQFRADEPVGVTARLIENAAVGVLDGVASGFFAAERARLLVIQAGLSAAGLGWREIAEVIESTPDLRRSGRGARPAERGPDTEARA